MWRVVSIVDRMGQALSAANTLLQTAVTTIDEEMERLTVRLHKDADELKEVVDRIDLSEDDRRELLDVTMRIEETATQVASFAHRPADAEAQIDALLQRAKRPDL